MARRMVIGGLGGWRRVWSARGILVNRAALLPPPAEVRLAHLWVPQELARRARQDDPPRLEHVAAGGDAERHARVLLDQEHRRAECPVELLDPAEHGLHEDRSHAQRALVHQEPPWPRHGPAA